MTDVRVVEPDERTQAIWRVCATVGGRCTCAAASLLPCLAYDWMRTAKLREDETMDDFVNRAVREELERMERGRLK